MHSFVILQLIDVVFTYLFMSHILCFASQIWFSVRFDSGLHLFCVCVCVSQPWRSILVFTMFVCCPKFYNLAIRLSQFVLEPSPNHHNSSGKNTFSTSISNKLSKRATEYHRWEPEREPERTKKEREPSHSHFLSHTHERSCSSKWNRNAISCRFEYCQATEAQCLASIKDG